jgi:hypothetical protein
LLQQLPPTPRAAGRGNRRDKRALHYQSFAIWPLVMTAELAARQGYDLYGMEVDGRSIHAAIDFLLRALADPSALSPYTTESQDLTFANALPWAEIYHRRFPRPNLEPYIGKGDVGPSMFGGPLTLYFFQPPTPSRTAEKLDHSCRMWHKFRLCCVPDWVELAALFPMVKRRD